MVSVPRAFEVTAKRSPSELAQEREWKEASARRAELKRQLARAAQEPIATRNQKKIRRLQSAFAGFSQSSWQRFSRDTRSA